MVRNEGDRLVRAVVSTPRQEYYHVDNLSEHNIVQLADKVKAQQQHNVLKSLMQKFGCEVIDILELRNHPNSVFTRDTAVCTHKGYVKLRMGLETRRGEEEWMAQVLDGLGESCVGSIKEPGTAEGGDIILAGSVVFVGQSQRTNTDGVQQLKELFNSMSLEVRVAVMPPGRIHLGGAMSMIGRRRIMHCQGVFSKGFFNGFDTIEVSSDAFISGNVICLTEEIVIAEEQNIEVIAKLRHAGVMVHEIDLSEFVKGRGGPTCLIMPVERKEA